MTTKLQEALQETSMEMDSDFVYDRSASIDITDTEQAKSLLAAWRGIYWFFNGRVDTWNIDENGNVSVVGFSTSGKHDPETILRDISGRSRRLEFGPAYLIVSGSIPPQYTDPQDMTNFSVTFLNKSVEDGTNRTPDYVRTAIADYKSEKGLKIRRGRRKTILRLDNLEAIDEEALRSVKPDDLDKLIKMAEAARSKALSSVGA